MPLHFQFLKQFSYVFHTIYDVALVIVGLIIVAFVSHPGRRHHLRWAYPTAVSMVLTACYRALIDTHYYGPPGARLIRYTRPDFASFFLYVSDVVGIYAGVMLWRVLHQLPCIWVRPHRKNRAQRKWPELGAGRRRRRRGRHPERIDR